MCNKFCTVLNRHVEVVDILVCITVIMVIVAHYVLTNELLPLLRKAAPSRVVIITSAAYSLGQIHYDDINQQKVCVYLSFNYMFTV